MLALILWAFITALFKRDRILWALFLIGFSQIGAIYPPMAKIRFELIVGVLALIFLFFSGDRLRNLAPSKSPINKYFYLFVIVAGLSVPFAVDPGESSHWLEYYFKRCWILFLLAVVLLNKEEDLKKFFVIYLISIFWLSMGAVISYWKGINVVEVGGVLRVQGATGILSNPNGLANTIVQSIPFIWFFFFYVKKRIYKAIIAGLGVISLTVVFLSGSRGGFYGLIAALFFLTLFSNRKKLAFVFFGFVMVGSLIIVSPTLVDRYSAILNPSNLGRSGDSRIWGLRHGISMLIRRPILGVGLGCYPVARRQWYHWSLWSHNHYGQLMGELGILGIFTWGMLVFHTIKGARMIRAEIISSVPQENYPFVYYLCLAIETATYIRLVLGMTTHSMHIFFWYLNAGLIVASSNILSYRDSNRGSLAFNA